MNRVINVFLCCLCFLFASSNLTNKLTRLVEKNIDIRIPFNTPAPSAFSIKQLSRVETQSYAGGTQAQYPRQPTSALDNQDIKPSKRQPYYPIPVTPPITAPPCYACFIVPALVAVGIAVGVSVPLSLINPPEVPDFDPNSMTISTRPQRIPENLAINNFLNITDDGCNKTSVLFDDGNCYPLLRPCENPLFWTTVDPITKRGRCSPRLCGRERVFIGRTQLCHDIEDPSECTGGRRLYYTAYGDPICDCPIGSYPFPTERDSCVPLFTQGPCPAGQVFSVLENGFGCTPSECQRPQPTNFLQQLLPGGDGFCYPLGSRGPCSEPSQLLGFNVLERKAECVDISDPLSPYFESPQLNDLLDRTYNQRSAEFDDFDITLISQNLLKRNDSASRKQDLNTFGIFQLPTSTPTSLLNPCRPGPNGGDNYKCTNPLVPNLRRRILLQAVRSAFTCARNAVLQAKGTCGGSVDQANCGPTYELLNLNNRCEKSII